MASRIERTLVHAADGQERVNKSARHFTILHDFPPPEAETAWRQYLQKLECPAHYDSPEFFREPYLFGTNRFAVLAFDGDAVTAVLTGLHKDGEVLSGLQSRPQVSVDPAADQKSAVDGLARGLLKEAGSKKLITVYSWNSLPLHSFEALDFQARELEGDVVLDLHPGPEALFKKLHASRRKNVRHGLRAGVEVFRAKTVEDAQAFYQVHIGWHQTKRKKIKSPEMPREAFLERFCQNGNFACMLARYSGRVIAGIVLRFFPGGLVEFSHHSSLDEFLYLKPNEVLQWQCIEWACGQGFSRCSLGGAHTFHRRFGGSVVPILRYRLDRSFLRRHARYEATIDSMRSGFHRLPPVLQKPVRRMMGRAEPAS
jgi:hypothetical protein